MRAGSRCMLLYGLQRSGVLSVALLGQLECARQENAEELVEVDEHDLAELVDPTLVVVAQFDLEGATKLQRPACWSWSHDCLQRVCSGQTFSPTNPLPRSGAHPARID